MRSNFLALGDEREKAGGGRGGLGRCEERQGVGHEFISDRLVAQQLCECHIERACGRDKTQVGLEAQPWRVEVACFDLTRRFRPSRGWWGWCRRGPQQSGRRRV